MNSVRTMSDHVWPCLHVSEACLKSSPLSFSFPPSPSKSYATFSKPRDPISGSEWSKNWDLRSKMDVNLTVLLFWASKLVPLRLKRYHKDQASHGIALDAPHAHILKRKQIGRKWGTKNWDMGSIMAVKLTFMPFWASEWVPCVWKGCRKTRHRMASLWTPHMLIF